MEKLMISTDQNTITFQDKTYQFVEDTTDVISCELCALRKKDICNDVPCDDPLRFDLKLGHFILVEP
jgi:hypothetical protein